MPVKGCSGDDLTEATEIIVDETIEQMSVAKGKGLITEGQYDEVVEQANKIREANQRLKCIADSVPKEIVNPENIVSEIKEDIDGDGNTV